VIKNKKSDKNNFTMTENIQQALQLATTNLQITILPTFSINAREDKTSATEWLQKVTIINKEMVGQTHFRNVL
jgi:hypothetical protein